MCDDPAEQRVLPRRLLVGVRVEGVAGELGEVVDVVERHLARPGLDGVADPQLREALAERVDPVLASRRPLGPPAGDRGEHVGRALEGRALHEVQYAAEATHLLTPAGPAGATVDERGQGYAVPGGLAGVVTVEDQDPAVPRR